MRVLVQRYFAAVGDLRPLTPLAERRLRDAVLRTLGAFVAVEEQAEGPPTRGVEARVVVDVERVFMCQRPISGETR